VVAGDCLFGQKCAPHQFSILGKDVGRMLNTFQPAGKMEECFLTKSAGLLKGTWKPIRKSLENDMVLNTLAAN